MLPPPAVVHVPATHLLTVRAEAVENKLQKT